MAEVTAVSPMKADAVSPPFFAGVEHAVNTMTIRKITFFISICL
jgi:hypothetical protein